MEMHLIADFLKYLPNKKQARPITSKASIEDYSFGVRKFAEYILSRQYLQSFYDVTKDIVVAYYASVVDQGYSSSIIYRRAKAVYEFYEWLAHSGQIIFNPCPKPPERNLDVLPRTVPSLEAVEDMYEKLQGSTKVTDQRDLVIIDLAFSCGLRREELQRLDIRDIRQGEGSIKVLGKNNKERYVPIGPKAMASLLHYINFVRPKIAPHAKTDALFISWKCGGKRMHVYSFNAVFRRLRRTKGFDRAITPHALRHAFGVELVRHNAPIQQVSEMMGHVKLETTQIYTKLAVSDLKKFHKELHPRG